MKVLLEIEDAEVILFDENKSYKVLKNFNNSQLLGFAKITKQNGKLYADINTKFLVDELYPAVGYKLIKSNKKGKIIEAELFAVGLSETENEDKRIPKVKDNIL